VWRSSLGLLSMGLTFQALILLPLADATAINFTAPIFATILSFLILKEHVGLHRWAAVLFGFAGVLVVARPGGSSLPALGVIIALIVSYAWLRPPALAAVDEGSRLMNGVGWAAVLPQMLASLGVIFAAAGVGTTIGAIVGAIIPQGSVLLAVVLYALGMVVFTMIMGNAFAAFPVMAAAIGVPILIQADGGKAAVVGAVGMLSGFCGTLMTPMAANFNIVPAALLELKNQYGVIKVQVATAIPLLIANIIILYVAGFRL